MTIQSIYHTYKRIRTLQTHHVSALPVVILMPHSACNCRCVMCDIWKDNHNLKQLTENDVKGLMESFKKFGTRQVVMSGGEALLHPLFFSFCEILKARGIKITVLSTGISLRKNANRLVDLVDDVIVSIDGDEKTHDFIRNINGAFSKLREGIQSIKHLKASFRITSRTVIHRLNFQKWSAIISAAKDIGVDQASFLPADVSSQAFNREEPWSGQRQSEIMLSVDELPTLRETINQLLVDHQQDFENKFIAESFTKLEKMHTYYSALHGLCDFPYKKCNAPWVSTVIESDGTVRPCFFHDPIGNIRTGSLPTILNGRQAMKFRQELDMDRNEICKKCVCYLNLPPSKKPS